MPSLTHLLRAHTALRDGSPNSAGVVIPWEEMVDPERFAPELAPEKRREAFEVERRRLFGSAMECATDVSLDWLKAHVPSLLPTADESVVLLGMALHDNLSVNDPLRVADWLVANTNVTDHLTSRRMKELMGQAFRADNTAGMAWMLHPSTRMPAWQDDPADPLLVGLLRQVNQSPHVLTQQDLPWLTQNIKFLLQEGVRPWSLPATPEEPEGTSPLHQLATAYFTEVSRCNENWAHIATPWNEALIALWPLLLKAGDTPHQRLAPFKLTVLERAKGISVLWGPLEGVTTALLREREAPASPTTRARPRRRS